MKKRFIKVIFFIGLLTIGLNVANAGTYGTKEFFHTSNGQLNSWWELWKDKWTYQTVYTNRNYEQNGEIVRYDTYCNNPGDNNCRIAHIVLPSDLPTDNGHFVYDENYIYGTAENNFETMSEKIYNQNILTGSYSFNTTYNNYFIFQSASWTSDGLSNSNFSIILMPQIP